MVSGPEGEKRWTVILSIDMIGFSEITQTIGNEKTYALLQEVLGFAKTAIETAGGHVVDTAGDGLLAAFGAPRALEDAAVHACTAALDFRDRLRSSADDLAKTYGFVPRFRTGIAGGSTMIARQGEAGIKVIGDPVNLAARLQALAEEDEILLTRNIRQEAAGFVQVERRAPVPIKGFGDDVELFALERMLDAPSRFDGARRRGLSELISRRDELNLCLSILNTRTQDRLLVIKGVAGVGKSRLIHEILNRLPEGRPKYLGQCAPTGQRNLAPIYQILRQASGSIEEATAEETLQRFAHQHPEAIDQTALQTVTAGNADRVDAFTRALQERELLAGALRWLSDEKHAVFVIEDAHWIDSASNDLLAMLVDDPIPMLVTARPTYDEKWLRRAGIHTMTLAPLGTTDIRQIVAGQFEQALSPALADLIADKSEGIPLIAEEIGRTLRRGDMLRQSANGLTLEGDQSGFVSGNLEQLVLARVDSLAPGQKALVQIAAAIGRDFDAALLRDVGKTDNPLEDLEGLVEHHHGTLWRFSHALIRDAVYGSLLSAQRAEIHARIAQAMKGATNTVTPALLADHYVKANDPTMAVRYLIRAAADARAVYALREVDQFLDQAFPFIETAPDTASNDDFGELALIWLSALDQSGRFGKLLDVADKLIPTLDARGLSKQATIARNLRAMGMTHTRDYAAAEALAKQTLAQAEAAGDLHGAAWAKMALMRIYDETCWQPEQVALSMADGVFDVAEAVNDPHLALTSLYLRTAVLRTAGRRKDALAVTAELAKFAETHVDRRAKAYASWAQALVHIIEGDPETAYAVMGPGKDNAVPGTADAHVLRTVELFCLLFLKPPDEVRPMLEDVRAFAYALPDYNIAHSAEWMLVVLAFREGRLAQAWAALKNLTPVVEAKEHLTFVRQCYMLKAEALLGIAGLIDPDAEAPAERPRFPRKKPTARDIAMFLWLKPQARRLARQALEHILALDPNQRGAYYARAKIGLGLLAEAQGKTDQAIADLKDGHGHALDEGLNLIAARAEPALRRLGINPAGPARQ